VVDAAWLKRSGPLEKTTFWFAIVQESSTAWFKKNHTLEEIRPREANGMALSPNGSERTASTDYWQTPDGEERYTDFSQHGMRADGTRDTGDVLEFASKVWDQPKPNILQETTRQMVGLAKQELESAAHAGIVPPDWVCALMTPAGWRAYDKLRSKTADAPTTKGIVTPRSLPTSQPDPGYDRLSQASKIAIPTDPEPKQETAVAAPLCEECGGQINEFTSNFRIDDTDGRLYCQSCWNKQQAPVVPERKTPNDPGPNSTEIVIEEETPETPEEEQARMDKLNASMWTEIEAQRPGCIVPARVVAYWAKQGRVYIATEVDEKRSRQIKQSWPKQNGPKRKVVNLQSSEIVEVEDE
jgi:hypothetical protein